MEMLLMGACLSMFGLAVAALAFGAATRDTEHASKMEAASEHEAVKPAVPRARFFVDPRPLQDPAWTSLPIEALLLQIENHVRLEQAAAESFLESPNASLLHSRTTSPLLN
jgi:hypothetical protein